MAITRAELEPLLQKLADEISNQARHLEAQRFVIQSIHTLMRANGTQRHNEIEDPVKALAVSVFSTRGMKPDPMLLEIILGMISDQTAEILQFQGDRGKP